MYPTYITVVKLRSFAGFLFLEFIIMVDVLSHLPYLKNIVFSNTSNHPSVNRVPWKIGNFSGVTTVYEEQFWRAILSILWCLLFTNSAKSKRVCRLAPSILVFSQSHLQKKQVIMIILALDYMSTCWDPRPELFYQGNKKLISFLPSDSTQPERPPRCWKQPHCRSWFKSKISQGQMFLVLK